MKKIRAFLAVELAEGLRERAVTLIDQLDTADADVKWVEPENLHITVKFLGDIDDVESWRVSQALEPVVKSCRRFEATLATTGAFPRHRAAPGAVGRRAGGGGGVRRAGRGD